MIITNPLSFKAYQSGGSLGKASLEIISPLSCTYGDGESIILKCDYSQINLELIKEYTILLCASFGTGTTSEDIQWQNDETIYVQEIPDSAIQQTVTAGDSIEEIYISFDDMVDYSLWASPMENYNYLRFCVLCEPSDAQAITDIDFFYSNELSYNIPEEVPLQNVIISTDKESYDLNTDTQMMFSATLIPSNAQYETIQYRIIAGSQQIQGSLSDTFNETFQFSTLLKDELESLTSITIYIIVDHSLSTEQTFSKTVSTTPLEPSFTQSTAETIARHKATWRGNDLNNHFDSIDDLYEHVINGDFEDTWVGDYFTVDTFQGYICTMESSSRWSATPIAISNVTFRVIDINYKTSSLGISYNLIFAPDKCLMNSPRTFQEDWANDTYLRGYIDDELVNSIKSVFNNHLVEYQDRISVQDSQNYTRYGVDLMTEDNMFGSSQSNSGYSMTNIFTTKFAGFTANPNFQKEIRIPSEILGETPFNSWYWLRDVNSSGYPLISMQGNSSQAASDYGMPLGVCPFIVFGGEA